jgi:small subunit ribosomal protein S4
MKLFLKGDKCHTKCPIDKKHAALPPGQHAHRRAGKPTEYAKRLREKQKARWISGVLEKQFQRYFAVAAHGKGNTGENLLRILETRLDNVVRRLGFAGSMSAARQVVKHGHVTVNGRKVDIPSYQTKPGDAIAIREDYKANVFVKRSLESSLTRNGVPGWLEWDGGLADAIRRSAEKPSLEGATLAGKVKSWPGREEMTYPVNEQFIVELYSK